VSGTGEPDWDLPLTWVQDGMSVTLDDGGLASVTAVPHGEGQCESGAPQGAGVTGSGEWSWSGHGRIVVSVDQAEMAMYSASYRGELDWSRLLVDPCGIDYKDPPVELFLDAPLSALRD
jgi:hypothetical protein